MSTSSPQGSVTQRRVLRRRLRNGVLCLVLVTSRLGWADGNEPRHWAFQPVRERAVPAVQDPAAWVRSAIDTFVLRRLRDAQLSPSPPADRERWLRRVTLDLTGLPPTLSEMDRFLADSSPDAHASVVDRLLASPAYGERMTVQWLDLARYADTYGYDNDAEIRMWPWRDWAIRAFNSNLPYDDFLRWQLAGDLLPKPTREQRLATAFNRLHRQNAEGGVLPEEFVVEYVIDRVQTFGNAFLGLSLECARCHDHKFDPISQRDFYGLYALFANIDEVGVYPEKTGGTPTPNMFLYAPGQEKTHARLEQAVEEAEAKLRAAAEQARDQFDRWRTTRRALPPAPPPRLHVSFDPPGPSQKGYKKVGVPKGARLVNGPRGKAMRFSGDHGVALGGHGVFERSDSFTMAAWLRRPDTGGRLVVWHNSKPAWEVGGRGYELALDDGHVEFSLTHVWPGNAIRVRSRQALEPLRWTHVAVTYDGSSRAAGLRIHIDAHSVAVDVVRDNLYGTIGFGRKPPLILGARLSETGFTNGELDEFGRTCYSQGELTRNNYGRDHHPRCFTVWMAGGGVRAGQTYGETDAFGYNVERDGVHVHDLHATMLALLGTDHEKLTYRYQGRDHRLTDVAGNVVVGLV